MNLEIQIILYPLVRLTLHSPCNDKILIHHLYETRYIQSRVQFTQHFFFIGKKFITWHILKIDIIINKHHTSKWFKIVFSDVALQL